MVKNVSGDDASGSLPIVNPTIIREWNLPYVRRLRVLCGPEIFVPNWVGEKHLNHSEELIDLKQQACPGFVEGQDPDVAELGPALYKNYAAINHFSNKLFYKNRIVNNYFYGRPYTAYTARAFTVVQLKFL